MSRGPFEWDEDFQRFGAPIDDFFDGVFGLTSSPRYGLQQTWRPSVDVYRVADGVTVVVEVPGIEEANLKLTIEHGRLRIAGNRPTVSVAPGAEPLQLEIDYGPFERVIALPPGADADRVTARFGAGLLTVHVPVRDQSRTVHVRGSDSTE
jgi:HSP20 family protein